MREPSQGWTTDSLRYTTSLRMTTFRGDGDPNTWIELFGEVNAFNAPQMRDQLLKGLAQRGEGQSAYLDLRRLTFRDFASVSALVTFSRTADNEGWDVRFFGPRPTLLRLLTAVGLGDRIAPF